MVEELFENFRELASITRRRKVSKNLTPMRVPDPVLKENAELLDRRSHLCDQLTEEKNRLQNCSPRIAQSIGTMIRYVQNELDQIEREIRRVVPNHPPLKAQDQILQSVKGIGEVCSGTVLASTCASTARQSELPDWSV